MKKFGLFLIAAIAVTAFTSCNDDDGGEPLRTLITTVRTLDGGDYYFQRDNGETLYPGNKSRIPGYKPDPDKTQRARKMMENEIMMMKRANINHVRNSHYPDDPYWYYLCNKYGIYLEDEANIESHEYYYGKASLSHPIEWKNAHVARVMEMVHANINNPSIVIWSLGNDDEKGKTSVKSH